MAWNTFLNDTGDRTKKIDADKVNENFDYLEPFVLSNNTFIQSNLQLTGSTGDGFPNTTNLYGWNMDSAVDTAATGSYAGTKFAGAIDLTLMAQKLTASNDVLGTSRYNTIIAGGYLQSTDANLNVANTADTDDFIVGGWVYIPDTTPASAFQVFSNMGAANNGWRIQLGTTGELLPVIDLAVDIVGTSYNMSNIASGWFHIIWTREVGVGTKLYVNGLLVGTGADASIGTTQSKFQLGGYNGANETPPVGVRYDECFFKKGILPTNLDDVIRNIYARSSNKFIVKDANTKIYSLDDNLLKLSSGIYTSVFTNTTNIAASVAYPMPWMRVGNVITVMFYATIDPTAAAPTTSRLTFTLPFPCPTLIGSGAAGSQNLAQSGTIWIASSTTATLDFVASSVNNAAWGGIFQYVVN